MLQRAFLGFVPAILALVFWFGAPTTSIGAPGPMASPWKADAAWSLVARGNSSQDISDISIGQSADQDDSPGRSRHQDRHHNRMARDRSLGADRHGQ